MDVIVDPDRCRGHALCFARAPEAFEFIDIEDRSVVIDGSVGVVPEEVFRAAARECPEQAIIVTDTQAGAS